MTDPTVTVVAKMANLNPQQVKDSLDLMDQGYTPAFLARYRKELTGNLDQATLFRLLRLRRKADELQKRKIAIIESLREQGKLTDEIKSQVELAPQMRLLEDIYLPFRPTRRTAGTIAAERGLEPLAETILEGHSALPLEQLAAGFIQHEHELHTIADVLIGARMIISERFGVMPAVRQRVRDLMWSQGTLSSSRGILPEELREFRDYFNFKEAIQNLPPHRVLAVNRGERKKALKVAIHVPLDELAAQCRALLVPADHPFQQLLAEALDDSLKRLVIPNIAREVRRELTEAAEQRAMEVFASNLTGMLMTPPVSGTKVLAIDPGFRTGCKVAALDDQGQLLGETIIYPHEPQGRWQESKEALLQIIGKHGIEIIAVGNGTGCHETEKLLTELISESGINAWYAMVSEAGASIYAAGELSSKEFPHLDPALRAAVSIGRRLQNPLAEFVKVDPRSIGVGLYQHDVDQEMLRARLEEVVVTCVNAVGADVNSANVSLLSKISGLDDALAAAIVESRQQEGPFASRLDLKRVPGMTDFVFTLCAGFLRVSGSKNPMSRTRVHPENYEVATGALKMLGYTLEDLAKSEGLPGLRQKLEKMSLEEMARTLEVGIPTLSDILFSLEHLDYDVRMQSSPPIFKSKMMQLEDLKPGMWLKGTVRNVVDFGAFVDIGVKEDGLVHVSQLSTKYIKNPTDFIHVGQTVDVRVVNIDHDRRRIALSMIRQTPVASQLAATGAGVANASKMNE